MSAATRCIACAIVFAGTSGLRADDLPVVEVEGQPLAANAERLVGALTFLGAPLPESVAKPLTAAAALLLVEDGVLGLDEPVDRWLPELANRRVLRSLEGPLDDTVPAARPITLRDLLTMRMGIGAVFADPAASPLLRRMAELEVAPGPRLFGHGPTALAQAQAAYRYFVRSGRDWSPWSCKPWY